MSISKIKEKSLTSDAVTESNLDTTAFTGQTELSEAANDSDILLIYDASSGSLKKILKSNVALANPIVSSVSPTNVLSGDGTGNATFTITGTNFDATATAKLVTTNGTEVNFDSVTRDSATQITAVIAISSLSNANEPYDVKVINGNGLANTLTDQINIDASPTFVTASGSLGTQLVDSAGSFSVNATDPESAGNVTFELQSGSLPPGYTITNTAAEGGTAIISGTDSTTSTTTTYNFVLRAVDAASNTSSRSFSIISRVLASLSFTASGTFNVPSGITSADVLVVGGGGGSATSDSGGGGAGGLIFFPSYPVTPSGTITVTVGCGAGAIPAAPNNPAGAMPNGNAGSDSIFGAPGDPGLSTGGILTAKGGGGGGSFSNPGSPGASGGGSGRDDGTTTNPSATQPTQPGNSGAYGFGSAGGYSPGPDFSSGGGGGGAGAAGTNGCGPGGGASEDNSPGGPGGIGKAYTIADGTTPVYYAGGGGGSAYSANGQIGIGIGGQGGGGNGAVRGPYAPSLPTPFPTSGAAGQAGQANKGGGAGGTAANNSPEYGNGGGKGVVIVRY
jgi:hypothetical protein